MYPAAPENTMKISIYRAVCVLIMQSLRTQFANWVRNPHRIWNGSEMVSKTLEIAALRAGCITPRPQKLFFCFVRPGSFCFVRPGLFCFFCFPGFLTGLRFLCLFGFLCHRFLHFLQFGLYCRNLLKRKPIDK